MTFFRLPVLLSLLLSSLSAGCYCSHTLESDDGSTGDGGVPAMDDAALPLDGEVLTPDGAVLGPGVIAVGADIRDVAADSERIYWIEYGTTEVTGRHRGDGVVRARPLDGGEAVTLVTGLNGPVRLSVTTTHALLQLDADRDADDRARTSVARASLADGTIDIVVPGTRTLASCVDSDGDRAFWAEGPGIHAMRASESEPVLLVPDALPYRCDVDGEHLYFLSDDEILRAPLAGGPAERFAALMGGGFAMHDGHVVSVVQHPMTGMTYLVELETDGAIRQMFTLAEASNYGAVETTDGLFAAEVDAPGYHLFGGSLRAGGDARAVVALPERPAFLVWTISRRGVVWSDGTTITLAPL